MAEQGISSGFKKAKRQGCKIVVVDLDEHIQQVRPFELSRYISHRKEDFKTGMIIDCYVVFKGHAVRVNAKYQTRLQIEMVMSELKP